MRTFWENQDFSSNFLSKTFRFFFSDPENLCCCLKTTVDGVFTMYVIYDQSEVLISSAISISFRKFSMQIKLLTSGVFICYWIDKCECFKCLLYKDCTYIVEMFINIDPLNDTVCFHSWNHWSIYFSAISHRNTSCVSGS